MLIILKSEREHPCRGRGQPWPSSAPDCEGLPPSPVGAGSLPVSGILVPPMRVMASSSLSGEMSRRTEESAEYGSTRRANHTHTHTSQLVLCMYRSRLRYGAGFDAEPGALRAAWSALRGSALHDRVAGGAPEGGRHDAESLNWAVEGAQPRRHRRGCRCQVHRVRHLTSRRAAAKELLAAVGAVIAQPPHT